MSGTFDFVPNSHVAEEIPPEERNVTSMNGWDFTAKPSVPYRAKFKLTLSGMRWRMSGAALDVTTDPTTNAGRLLNFYKTNRTWDSFTYNHEYLGAITCRFADAVAIPKAFQNSNGLIPEFEVVLVHHNPGY